MLEHIHHSNLIENIDDPSEDHQSLMAWSWLEDQQRIDQPVLLELHRLITLRQLPPSERGHYRKVNVRVGRHHLPDPMVAQGQIYNWLLDLMNHWKTLDPKEMHIRFEKIHPFIDGNGRTGRMLMWWHERMLGREPTLINIKDRQDYYKWFKTKEEIAADEDRELQRMLDISKYLYSREMFNYGDKKDEIAKDS